MKKINVILKGISSRLSGTRLKQRMLIVSMAGVLIPLTIISVYMNLSTKRILAGEAKKAEISELSCLRDLILSDMNRGSTISDIQTGYQNVVSNRKNGTAILYQGETVLISDSIRSHADELKALCNRINQDISTRDTEYNGEKSRIICLGAKKPADKSLVILSIISLCDIYEKADRQSLISILYITFGILPSAAILILFSNHFGKRVHAFQVRMHKTAEGNFKTIEKIGGNDEFSELYDDLNTMIDSIQHLLTTVYEEQVQKEKLNSRQKDVEFKMLASQINPHFLYNTLETIRMKARCDGESEIEELVKMLAKIMRRNIQVGDNLVTLKSELELVEYYLRIQQYRFGERVCFHIELNCGIDHLKIMPLIIQPVVENAFVHGLETKEGEGEIRIRVERDDRLRIHVIDNGIGMPKEKLNEIKASLNDFSSINHSSIGLNNVNQRIKLLYGDKYGIYIDSKENAGTTVIIELPEDMT